MPSRVTGYMAGCGMSPKISYTPNAVSGHREYGLLYLPIQSNPIQSNPIQAAVIVGSESRCAVAGSHGVSVPSVHAVDASIYYPS